MRPVLGASACLWRADKVLLAKRGKPPFLWSLPGGHVEFGESLRAAAERELLEETGISASLPHFVQFAEVIRADVHFVIACYSGFHERGEAVAGSDALEVAWVSVNELAGFDMTTGTADVILRASRLPR